MRTTKVSLVKRRGRGVVEREGEGRQQGTGPHHTSREETKTRGGRFGRRPGKRFAQVATLTPCETGLVLGPAGAAGRRYMLHFADFLVEFRGIPPREPPISGTRVTTNWAGERPTRHHVPLPCGDIHCRFLPFLSLCCRASCLLCGRCCAGVCLTRRAQRLHRARVLDNQNSCCAVGHRATRRAAPPCVVRERATSVACSLLRLSLLLPTGWRAHPAS